MRFGAAPASEVQVLDDATLTCRVPQGSPGSLVDLELTNSNGRALLSGALRYLDAPVLQAVAPPGGTPFGGTSVTLTGTDFDASGAGLTTVRFGASTATQVTILNEMFSPTQEQFDRAHAILDAYEEATTTGDRKGAVMFGDEMIDEASRKVAVKLVSRGERAGLIRSES